MRSSKILKITFSIICIELLLFSSAGLQSSTRPNNIFAKIQQQAFAQEQCDPNAETIQRDSSGPLVVILQTALTQLQFDPGLIDGVFGEGTGEGAVIQFQQANTLDVDGIVGPQTWGVLCQLATSAPHKHQQMNQWLSETELLKYLQNSHLHHRMHKHPLYRISHLCNQFNLAEMKNHNRYYQPSVPNVIQTKRQ